MNVKHKILNKILNIRSDHNIYLLSFEILNINIIFFMSAHNFYIYLPKIKINKNHNSSYNLIMWLNKCRKKKHSKNMLKKKTMKIGSNEIMYSQSSKISSVSCFNKHLTKNICDSFNLTISWKISTCLLPVISL